MMTLLAPDGTRTELKPGGWEHFAKPSTSTPQKISLTLLPSIVSAPIRTHQKLMRDATKIIRSTLTRPVPGEPLQSGPVFAAPYHTPGDPSDTPYTYARSHNPTWTALENSHRPDGVRRRLPGQRAGLRLRHGRLHRRLRSSPAPRRHRRPALELLLHRAPAHAGVLHPDGRRPPHRSHRRQRAGLAARRRTPPLARVPQQPRHGDLRHRPASRSRPSRRSPCRRRQHHAHAIRPASRSRSAPTSPSPPTPKP